ncbi:YybH family protein [Poriferisphaera sp. WC338]|uniref:YybH family protein n=1 Tax=Poriferisphaera sp. WC338 TaxID=3425129 RepID=UPI003D812AA3
MLIIKSTHITPQKFIQAYESTVNNHELKQTLNMIDEHAVYWFSDGSSHVNKNEIENAIRRNFEIIKNETYSINDLKWLTISENIAACIYRFRWTGTINNKPASGSGRGTSILTHKNGTWLVIHEHLSKEAAPLRNNNINFQPTSSNVTRT